MFTVSCSAVIISIPLIVIHFFSELIHQANEEQGREVISSDPKCPGVFIDLPEFWSLSLFSVPLSFFPHLCFLPLLSLPRCFLFRFSSNYIHLCVSLGLKNRLSSITFLRIRTLSEFFLTFVLLLSLHFTHLLSTQFSPLLAYFLFSSFSPFPQLFNSQRRPSSVTGSHFRAPTRLSEQEDNSIQVGALELNRAQREKEGRERRSPPQSPGEEVSLSSNINVNLHQAINTFYPVMHRERERTSERIGKSRGPFVAPTAKEKESDWIGGKRAIG